MAMPVCSAHVCTDVVLLMCVVRYVITIDQSIKKILGDVQIQLFKHFRATDVCARYQIKGFSVSPQDNDL